MRRGWEWRCVGGILLLVGVACEAGNGPEAGDPGGRDGALELPGAIVFDVARDGDGAAPQDAGGDEGAAPQDAAAEGAGPADAGADGHADAREVPDGLQDDAGAPDAEACDAADGGRCDAGEPPVETCNGLDDDGDGATDEGTGGGACVLTSVLGTCPGRLACVAGHLRCQGTPASAESCNGADDDCDGATDEAGAAGCRAIYRDRDGDGYGVPGSGRCLCASSGTMTATADGDCDDLDPGVRPGRPEACNGIDDDCDGDIDEGAGGECFPAVCDRSAGRCRAGCNVSSDCQPGTVCAGGRCRLPDGLACAEDAQCASGFCTDGVCCDARCDRTCESCALAGRAGRCDPIPALLDPDDECEATAPSRCRTTGACSGQRSCAMHPAGTPCGAAAACATASIALPADACDGAGACVEAGTRDCFPYACAPATGGCATSCQTASDCAPGAVCGASTGRCLARAGLPCSSGAGCLDGACCDGTCRDLQADVAHCGSCSVSCRNPHGTTACRDGTCRPACSAGFGDCDGRRANGCETSLRTTTDCGACGAACSLDGGIASCDEGDCVLAGCLPGRADCDGDASGGCELVLSGAGNTCDTAEPVGGGCGDVACGAFCPAAGWQSFAMRSGRQGRWFVARVGECSDCCADVSARVTLSVPQGVDDDLFVYGACGELLGASTRDAGQAESVVVHRPDGCLGGDSGFDVRIEVRHLSGAACDPWILDVSGTACP